MCAEPVGDRLDPGELDQIELVDGRHQAEELLLGHQLADAGEADRAVRRRVDPRPRRQVARVHRAEEGLVRRVGDGLLERPQRARGTPTRAPRSRASSRDGFDPCGASPGT